MSRELLRQVIAECSDDERIWSISSDLYCAILEYLEIPEPEPVAWMSKTFPTTFATSKDIAQPAMFFTPLYAEPVDQSARIAELEKQLAELQTIRGKCTLVPTDKLENMQRKLKEQKPIGYIPQHSAAIIKREGMWDACTLYRTKVDPTDVEVFL